MDIDSNKIWERALASLKEDSNQQTYNTWFQSIRFIEVRDKTVILGVPSKFFKDWIEEHYGDTLAELLERISGKKFSLEFIILPENTTAKESGGEAGKTAPLKGLGGSIPMDKTLPFFFKKPFSSEEPRLNLKYTFDSFVVGASNRFAHAAALAVSESPAKAYNPLFIYGKVGMGKTHLMQAIGHHILKTKSNLKFIYMSSEKFTNQLIGAIQNRTTLKFRQMYRNADLLLIDDIHFIAGKESTQEEFFHTFNALYDAHKQIVVSSDRSPKDIPALEERLVSRFEWGLVTDIQPPDLETRIAILRKKAEREGVDASDDVTYFIGEKIRSNIRELEGALIRVAAYAKLVGREINVELVKEVLKDILMENKAKITIELIQQRVAQHYDMRISDMRTKRRTKAIVYPRQVAMYLSRSLTDSSLPEIGEWFGGRDHSTVLHACEKIQNDIKSKDGTKETIDSIKGSITGHR